jgi:hypothetical protein
LVMSNTGKWSPFMRTRIYHRLFLDGSVLLIFLAFCVMLFALYWFCVLCLMWSVSLDCPFLIVPSGFFNVNIFSSTLTVLLI